MPGVFDSMPKISARNAAPALRGHATLALRNWSNRAPNGWPVMRWQCPTCRTEIHALTTDVKNKELLRALLTCAEAHLRQIDEDERMI